MIQVVDAKLLEALAATAPALQPQHVPASRIGGRSLDVEQFIARHGLAVLGPDPYNGGQRWVFPVCPWNHDHTNHSAFILQLASGAVSAGCHHNGCQGKGWHELRDL